MQLRALWYTLGALVWASVPLVAWAQNANPLVPTTAAQGASGCNTVAGAAQSCNICVFGALFQNIINFAIGLSIPIAAVMFAYAGWLYFSNAENTAQIAKAHKIFTTVLIGFAIAVGGWLVVQTILATLTGNAYQSWSNIKVQSCTGKRTTDAQFSQVLANAGVHPQVGAPVPVAQQVTPTSDGNTNVGNSVCDGTSYFCGSGNSLTASGPVSADVQNGVNELDSNAQSGSTGQCAYYVRQALSAEGYTDFDTNHPASAYQYDSYLKNDGFTSVADQSSIGSYAPQAGDVAVFQPIPGHSDGHIAMYDGSQWVSDFKQNSMYAASGYQNGSYAVYRPGSH